jgi:NTE family protein
LSVLRCTNYRRALKLAGMQYSPFLRPPRWLHSVALLLTTLLMAGCASTHYPINPPLARIDAATGYRAHRVFSTDPDDNFFLNISFSGGGTRAAALGFGVLEAMRDTPISWQGKDQRLIDQIDVMGGVSGGSILAAAFGLEGADGMPRFERDFLQAPLQSALLARMMSPRTLWRLGSPRFGRSEVLAELLDERLFHGATFADLSRARKKPFTVLSASDMATGGRFEFNQDAFDFFCGDLDGVSVARAVAASSAVPLVLSPVTLWNYAAPSGSGDAGCGEPAVEQATRTHGSRHRATRRMSELRSFRELNGGALSRPFIHLLDGGLSDNVNARGPADFAAQTGGVVRGANQHGYRGVRRVAFIVVNAETSARSAQDTSADVPGPIRSALALADIPINRNSEVALVEARTLVATWESEVRAAHAAGDYSTFAADAQLHFVEVNFAAEPDAVLRERMMAIATSLELPPDDVRLLREYGARALRAAPAFQKLLESLKVP